MASYRGLLWMKSTFFLALLPVLTACLLWNFTFLGKASLASHAEDVLNILHPSGWSITQVDIPSSESPQGLNDNLFLNGIYLVDNIITRSGPIFTAPRTRVVSRSIRTRSDYISSSSKWRGRHTTANSGRRPACQPHERKRSIFPYSSCFP